MKLFSWSTLFFLLSLSFLWGCGYWAWLQTNQSQQAQLEAQLSLQLERSEVLLEDWQRNYRLHLDYLRADLAKTAPVGTDNILYDPWQELDDKIQHAPWPDALLGYALIDDAGRAVRLSNTFAGQLFTITETDFSSNHQFLQPIVLPAQWVAPVHLEWNGQHLLFWFDLAALKQKLLKALNGGAGETMLVSTSAQLVSPSRYQQTLLARFGPAELRDDFSLKFFLKRPPEDLTRSSQRYDGNMAWPETRLAQLMSASKQGQTPVFVPNYLGRPSFAVWRWSDSWQSYLVAERDLTSLQNQRKIMRQYLLAGLSVVTLMLLLLFWLIQRGVSRSESETAVSVVAPVDLPGIPQSAECAGTLVQSDSCPEGDLQGSVATETYNDSAEQLKRARALLQAWLAQPGAPDGLQEVSRLWLQMQQNDPVSALHCQPVLLFSQQLTALQQLMPQEILLVLADDIPEWAIMDVNAVTNALDWIIRQRATQHDVSTLMVKINLVEPQSLQLEISDDGATLTQGQWLTLLHPQQDSAEWPPVLRQLQQAGGHFSAAAQQFSGNKLLLTVPLQILTAARASVELQLVDGAALLLCPPGDAQQLYRSLLKQTGLALMPLDDAEQFLQWCSAQADARLDYLILDEAFIKADQQIASQVFQVVRRYFPQLALLVLVRQPQQWQALQQQFQLRLISKPVLRSAMQQALVANDAASLMPGPRDVWYEAGNAMDTWLLETELTQLGYRPRPLMAEQSLPTRELLLLPLENFSAWQQQLQQHPLLWYTVQPIAIDTLEQDQLVWTPGQGLAVLSQRLFQLSTRLESDED